MLNPLSHRKSCETLSQTRLSDQKGAQGTLLVLERAGEAWRNLNGGGE